ncbi:hypothetical protein AXG93_3856s1140 [Marchantia polymorpha subsp. ruderalis]|uniref:Uncharacterized protein n=1 Tax=Marchantia polymorpha subsp. ruderalis TaxID=1480154 RepID=A0A176VXV9_MARPO|nr:hypothetical protein AXG93_3856s1140 [Marchantia polymorpha subsp. ruderalis]
MGSSPLMGGELAGSQARGLGSGAGVLVGQLFFSWCMMIISMHAMRSPGLVLLQQQQQPGGSHWVATGGHDRPGRARKGEAEPNRERKRERGEQLRAVVAPGLGFAEAGRADVAAPIDPLAVYCTVPSRRPGPARTTARVRRRSSCGLRLTCVEACNGVTPSRGSEPSRMIDERERAPAVRPVEREKGQLALSHRSAMESSIRIGTLISGRKDANGRSPKDVRSSSGTASASHD